MQKCLLAALLLGGLTTASSALDIKELAPCRPAAARYCDRSDTSMSMTNLLRCGATLASVSGHVGAQCREVLRRYGQL